MDSQALEHLRKESSNLTVLTILHLVYTAHPIQNQQEEIVHNRTLSVNKKMQSLDAVRISVRILT